MQYVEQTTLRIVYLGKHSWGRDLYGAQTHSLPNINRQEVIITMKLPVIQSVGGWVYHRRLT